MVSKLDGTDQYIRRQNLEFADVLVTENEDFADIIVNLNNLAEANVKKVIFHLRSVYHQNVTLKFQLHQQ